MNETKKLGRPYCPNCKFLYFLLKGSRHILDKEKNEKMQIKFEILGCNCEEILLYDLTQLNWQVFGHKFKSYPRFDLKNRRFYFQ